MFGEALIPRRISSANATNAAKLADTATPAAGLLGTVSGADPCVLPLVPLVYVVPVYLPRCPECMSTPSTEQGKGQGVAPFLGSGLDPLVGDPLCTAISGDCKTGCGCL